MYVGDINGFQPIQKSDRAMTYLNSRFGPLNDDITLFGLDDLNGSKYSRPQERRFGFLQRKSADVFFCGQKIT